MGICQWLMVAEMGAIEWSVQSTWLWSDLVNLLHQHSCVVWLSALEEREAPACIMQDLIKVLKNIEVSVRCVAQNGSFDGRVPTPCTEYLGTSHLDPTCTVQDAACLALFRLQP